MAEDPAPSPKSYGRDLKAALQAANGREPQRMQLLHEPFVFLSYAREDTGAAEALVARLTANAIQVRWDKQFEPGVAIEAEIQRLIEMAAAVIVIYSETALSSAWVGAEAALAREQKKLIPVLVQGFDASRLPFLVRPLHCCCISDERLILAALARRGL